MKSFCGIFLALVVVLTVAADGSESDEIEKIMTEHANACQKELKATEKDMTELMDRAEPTTKIAKCLLSCVMSKLGVINDSNMLVAEKIKTCDTIKSKDGKPLKDFVKEISDACKSVTDPDKCEAGAKIASCLNKEAQERGFDKNAF